MLKKLSNLKLSKKNSFINILEVGCGSGVIAINLALTNPLWKVDGVDISLKALNLSKKNLNLHPLLKVNFKKSDLFQNITKKYHVIIANLPYVENTFPIKPQILKWDPVCALFAGVDGLKLLDKLLQQINKYIYKKYLIALEIGYKQKEGMIKLIKKHLPKSHFIFKKDYAQKIRFVFIYFL